MSNLTNAQKATYALLADNVYWDVRSSGYDENTNKFTNSNWTPVPEGWTVLGQYDMSGSGDNRTKNPDLDGFSARVFQNTATNEIAIAVMREQDNQGDIGSWQIYSHLRTLLVEEYAIAESNPTMCG